MKFKAVACNLFFFHEKQSTKPGDNTMLPHLLQSCIDSARTFQKKLLNLFTSRSYASLQLVEALAHASKPTTVVELSQETPFQRSYSVINKILNSFGVQSLVPQIVNIENPVNKVQRVDPIAFSRITKPFSNLFFEMLPQEVNRKFRLYALDATSTPRIHAHTLDDRSYVHQANQIGIPVTVGLEASVLIYLPEHSAEEANWQLPISLERIPTDTTACEVAKTQLQLLAESLPTNSLLTVIVADCAYGSLEPYSEDQVVVARGRADRQGRRPTKNDQTIHKRRGRPRKYESETIRFIEDMPPGTKGGSDEECEYEDIIRKQPVDVLLNRWNDVYVEGHSELVDVVKVEIFAKNDYEKTLLPPLLLILSGKRRREISALEAYQSYRRRFDIEHFFRFAKQKLLFCAYQTPDLDHQISWWWFCCMAYWLLYHVRHIGEGSTRPWHKKRDRAKPAGPGEVKRLFATRIFPVLGSLSPPPTNREKSKGRVEGVCFPKRERKKVVKKGRKQRKVA
ncbi:MAG TPA: transposase [Fusibacter sp.]|nr:transposase [Fusibacter sp.]